MKVTRWMHFWSLCFELVFLGHVDCIDLNPPPPCLFDVAHESIASEGIGMQLRYPYCTFRTLSRPCFQVSIEHGTERLVLQTKSMVSPCGRYVDGWRPSYSTVTMDMRDSTPGALQNQRASKSFPTKLQVPLLWQPG
jgi:hypothetical protein